ncbi:luciferin-binding protein-like [Liolophura sinensis]|uniref:luciferin-binding protein-like n=1 Tax=Liolophura sinensis TaxID=3198878 RepID=UPI0031581EEB
MALSEGLENKVRKAFRFFDLDKDGILTREEMINIAHKISALSNATKEEAEVTRREWTKWCDFLFPEGQITEDDYIERGKKMFDKDGAKIKAEDYTCYNNVFERLDSNKDGFISPEELRMYYKAFGYGEDYDIDKVFQSLDSNKDGMISREEFVKATVDYWTTDSGYEFFYDVPRK